MSEAWRQPSDRCPGRHIPGVIEHWAGGQLHEACIHHPNLKGGGNRTHPASYRPVALTSHLSKVMERLIRGPMVEHLESHGLMNGAKHGSRAGRSTLSQLLVQYDQVLKHLENGNNCEVVYIDFANAFD